MLGGGKIVLWKSISEYELRYETNEEEIIEVDAFNEEDKFDENNIVSNAILGL